MNSEFPTAVHLLVYLAHKPGQTANSEELALNVDTHSARVRKTMSGLRAEGWVGTREGNGGGYFLQAAPDKIRLSDVYSASCCGGLRPKKKYGPFRKRMRDLFGNFERDGSLFLRSRKALPRLFRRRDRARRVGPDRRRRSKKRNRAAFRVIRGRRPDRLRSGGPNFQSIAARIAAGITAF